MNSVRSTEVSKSSNKIWQFECLKVKFISLRNDILSLISLCAQCSEHFCMVSRALQGQYWFSVAMDLLILMECATSEALSCLLGWQWRERRGWFSTKVRGLISLTRTINKILESTRHPRCCPAHWLYLHLSNLYHLLACSGWPWWPDFDPLQYLNFNFHLPSLPHYNFVLSADCGQSFLKSLLTGHTFQSLLPQLWKDDCSFFRKSRSLVLASSPLRFSCQCCRQEAWD